MANFKAYFHGSSKKLELNAEENSLQGNELIYANESKSYGCIVVVSELSADVIIDNRSFKIIALASIKTS